MDVAWVNFLLLRFQTMLFSFLKSDPGDVSGYPIVKHGKLSLVDLAGKNIKKKINELR